MLITIWFKKHYSFMIGRFFSAVVCIGWVIFQSAAIYMSEFNIAYSKEVEHIADVLEILAMVVFVTNEILHGNVNRTP